MKIEVPTANESEVGERRGKVVERVAETAGEGEVGEGGGKVVYL